MKLEKNKEQAQKRTLENYVIRLLVYVHRQRQNDNFSLYRENYKYFEVNFSLPKTQFITPTLSYINMENKCL